MSSSLFTLDSSDDLSNIADISTMRIGIVVSQWNSAITESLLEAAVSTLKANGIDETGITVVRVPGSFELVYGCAQLAKHGYVDAIIAIGCVIRGDTPHFDYICAGTTQGLVQLNVEGSKPIIYGLITANTLEQAQDRAGGKLGNKGSEYAITAIKMVDYAWQLQK